MATRDVARGNATASALQTLADEIHTDNWPRVKNLVEAVFIASGHPVPVITREALPVLLPLQAFCETYLGRRLGKVTPKRHALLKRVLTHFWRMHKGLELGAVMGAHVQSWTDALAAKKKASGTIWNELCIVSAMFKHAIAMGHIVKNPCVDVDVAEYAAAVLREAISDEDTALLLSHLSAPERREWLTVSLLTRHAGLRLKDATLMEDTSVIFHECGACLVSLTPGKTKNPELLPVYGPLVDHLRGLGIKGKLTPTLHAMASDRLSKDFHALLVEAGVECRAVVVESGRTYFRISHHSLKHAYITGLARRGVPEHIRKRLAAHVTSKAHRVYDHTDSLDLHRLAAPFFATSN